MILGHSDDNTCYDRAFVRIQSCSAKMGIVLSIVGMIHDLAGGWYRELKFGLGLATLSHDLAGSNSIEAWLPILSHEMVGSIEA